jgi:hypothetical protein
MLLNPPNPGKKNQNPDKKQNPAKKILESNNQNNKPV